MAGSLESMDCLVSVSERPLGSGLVFNIEGNGAELFRSSVTGTVNQALALFNVRDVEVCIRDQGALEPVLSARLETALIRYLAAADEREP